MMGGPAPVEPDDTFDHVRNKPTSTAKGDDDDQWREDLGHGVEQ